MDTIKQSKEIIAKALKLLDEKDQNGLKYRGVSVPEIIDNGISMLHKSEEKTAILKAWSVQEANRVIGFLWRAEKLTPELEKEYRALPKMEEAAKDYEWFVNAHKVEADELEAQRKKYADYQRELDLFQGVLGGMTKEQAQEEYDRWQQSMQQAVGGR